MWNDSKLKFEDDSEEISWEKLLKNYFKAVSKEISMRRWFKIDFKKNLYQKCFSTKICYFDPLWLFKICQ